MMSNLESNIPEQNTVYISDMEQISNVKCNAFRNPISCPLILYIVLSVIGIIGLAVTIFMAPRRDGNEITTHERWIILLIGIFIHLIFTFFFGWLLYALCSRCENGWAWFLVILAFVLPIILYIIIAIIAIEIANSIVPIDLIPSN